MAFRHWMALFCLLLGGCGRTSIVDNVDAGSTFRPEPTDESCNGLDDDLDGRVDEDFVDEGGRYVNDAHCGRCDAVCSPPDENTLTAGCRSVDDVPTCAALECVEGFTPSNNGRCIAAFDRLCLPCTDDADCGNTVSASCSSVGDELRCTVGCELGCPSGYRCVIDQCLPEGGSCSCDPGDDFVVACALRDPEGEVCPGEASCDDGVLSQCVAPEEICDELDNDCDGAVDEGFADELGFYGLDVNHCGGCGIDCSTTVVIGAEVICGGEPQAPRCALRCPDSLDGVQPGDELDADGDLANGCECTVSNIVDAPGPPGAVGEDLDVNCDGADGDVGGGIYVRTDGDDGNPGTPSLPLKTITEGLNRAAASLDGPEPKRDVYAASGTYIEAIVMPDGVNLHGGYQRDFLALSPEGFRSEVRAPVDTPLLGGAALAVDGAGATPTLIEGLFFRGRDGLGPAAPAFGAYFLDPGPALSMRNVTIESGLPGVGVNGNDGASGVGGTAAQPGQPPRAAVETIDHACIEGAQNVVQGGTGGANTCNSSEVSGGRGGDASCPMFGVFEGSGQSGKPAAAGGAGGTGGQGSAGPISGVGCPSAICCGLADFSVPSEFSGPLAGSAGADGAAGAAGSGCLDFLGSFADEEWRPGRANVGIRGSSGSGGGGGGAGGGPQMNWFDGVCEFADGIGGGGGGGGAGGCGGLPGRAGTSGGPSVALLVRYTATPTLIPELAANRFSPSDGARGGDGGAGGDGGPGGSGASGGDIDASERTTPTLAGAFAGSRGGQGGAGGPGGGGGGGCGGPSVGIWLTGVVAEPTQLILWRVNNTFALGSGGNAGQGGAGAAPGGDGTAGGAIDVIVR